MVPEGKRRREAARARAGLGTFGGVFTPSILTILGLVLFLRLGFVVGAAGLGRALVILAIASAISLLTSSSLSAIATNRKVRGGGDYYLISRSLGIAYGGALGLLLFVAQSVSVAFYCLGFGEAVSSILTGVSPLTAAFAAGAVLLVLAYLGADAATRFQYVIMAVLAAALVSFFVGGAQVATWARLETSWPAAEGWPGFWMLFAIFFPAVTGFTQGVSMSGDLRDPKRSLPLGTFWAVGLSIVVYAAAMAVFAAAAGRPELVGDQMVMRELSLLPWLSDAGVLAATLSSALASFLGAPRILQGLSADGIFPQLRFLAHAHGPSQNPRRAVLLTAVIAFATILVGSLDAVASLVSMFFLISYGLLNYATYVEATAQSPSFRPRFRFYHRYASLAGTILALGAMVAINLPAAAFAGAIMVAIQQYLRRTAIPAPWRDARRAYRFHRIKRSLQEVADEPEDPRDWQPHILAFTEGEERRERLLRFASWMSGGTGFITAVQIVPGEIGSETAREARETAERELHDELERHDLDAFPLAIAANDLRIAAGVLVQSWGVGPIRVNTVMLNWLGEELGSREGTAEMWYARLLANAIRLGRSVVVLNVGRDAWEALRSRPAEERRIDVWWTEDASSRLALLFAYLMTRTDAWEDARIRVLVPAPGQAEESIRANMEYRLEEMRIDAEVEPLSDPERGVLVERAKDAALFLLPLRLEGMRLQGPFGGSLSELLDSLGAVALVGAAADVRLGEEGRGEGPREEGEAESEPGAPDEA